MKRVVTPEFLDEDLGSPEEIRQALLDLDVINRNFGGFRSMAALLRRASESATINSLTFLDVAGGTGGVADQVRLQLLIEGIAIRATVLDRSSSHLCKNTFQLAKVAGDALALPFANGSFDVVGCNLFCHHLDPDHMVRFFNEAIRVARLCVVASDLRRNLFHWIAAYAGRLIYRSRLTRNDAPASVRRAYTIPEVRAIARQSAAATLEVERHYFQRFGLILWKLPP